MAITRKKFKRPRHSPYIVSRVLPQTQFHDNSFYSNYFFLEKSSNGTLTNADDPGKTDVREKSSDENSRVNLQKEGEKILDRGNKEQKGLRNIFHRDLKQNWSKLLTDKISALAFTTSLKGRQYQTLLPY